MMYLLIPKIEILNANALSGTYIIGFPAMTAWLGAVHALQRKINQAYSLNIRFPNVAVSVSSCHVQWHKSNHGRYNALSITSNPLIKANGTWKSSFIPEGRVHVTVTLLVECSDVTYREQNVLCQYVSQCLSTMKMAGGDVISFQKPEILIASDDDMAEKRILYRLMPGYVLIERRDLIAKGLREGYSSIEALLSYLTIKEDSVRMQKKIPGWLVPIVVGYKGISDLGNVKRQRDSEKIHQFVENIVTLGEFKMPYRFERIQDIMWHYEYSKEKELYLCRNKEGEL